MVGGRSIATEGLRGLAVLGSEPRSMGGKQRLPRDGRDLLGEVAVHRPDAGRVPAEAEGLAMSSHPTWTPWTSTLSPQPWNAATNVNPFHMLDAAIGDCWDRLDALERATWRPSQMAKDAGRKR